MRPKWRLLLVMVVFAGSCSVLPSGPVPPADGFLPATEETAAATESVLVDAPSLSVRFDPSDSDVQNPERGFATDADWQDRDYSQYYDDGYTLVYIDIRLDEYRERDLSVDFLDGMEARLARLRGSGIKAIIRFSYNDGPYPNPEPDASLDQILRHIQQVKPLLESYSDVIAWMEAGFIGAWGEWHASTYRLDNNPAAKKEILFSLLDALPPDRMVLLRYPVDIMTIFPEPLSESEAFNGTYHARIGFHNDCFLSSYNDENTYGRNGVFTVDDEMDYLSQMTRYVPVGGESCDYRPPRSDCETALEEVSLLHFTELNDGWYPEVLDAWEEQGCYGEIQSRLGYRFVLASAVITESAPPGGILHLEVRLKNEGFASLVNPRRVFIVLDGPARFEVALPEDPRFWAPSEDSSFSANLRLPASMPDGQYRVAVWMPDVYETLRDDPRYSVRFANDGVWDDRNGLNVLATITIDSSIRDNVDASAETLELLP